MKYDVYCFDILIPELTLISKPSPASAIKKLAFRCWILKVCWSFWALFSIAYQIELKCLLGKIRKIKSASTFDASLSPKVFCLNFFLYFVTIHDDETRFECWLKALIFCAELGRLGAKSPQNLRIKKTMFFHKKKH